MKKTLIILAFVISSSSLAQNNSYNYEIKTAPIALIARWVTLDFSFVLTGHWVMGPSVIIYASPKIGNMFAPSYNGYAAGAHAYGYMNPIHEHGWYWGNHLYYESYDSYPHNFQGHYELKGTKINTSIGYSLAFKFGMKLHFGGGVESRNYHQKDIIDDVGSTPNFKSQSTTLPFIEAKLGYLF